jgi:hypothetical protein
MGTETAAGTLASHLPGDYQENIAAVVRLRGERVLKLRAAGLNARAIHEATGWTYRQQRWAVKAIQLEKGGR